MISLSSKLTFGGGDLNEQYTNRRRKIEQQKAK